MNLKIIVVDDEVAYLDIVERFLSNKSWKVVKCNSSIAALDLVKHNDFDVLITDIGMPIVNGFELITEAKKTSPNIKIICLSGYVNLLDEDPAFQEGAVLLSKPFLIGDLLNCLEGIVQPQES